MIFVTKMRLYLRDILNSVAEESTNKRTNTLDQLKLPSFSELADLLYKNFSSQNSPITSVSVGFNGTNNTSNGNSQNSSVSPIPSGHVVSSGTSKENSDINFIGANGPQVSNSLKQINPNSTVASYITSTETQQIKTNSNTATNEGFSIITAITEAIHEVDSFPDNSIQSDAPLMQMVCRYENSGCKFSSILLTELIQHEPDCIYQSSECLAENCNWQSNLHNLHKHITEEHRDRIYRGSSSSFVLPVSLLRSMEPVYFFQTVDDYLFIITVTKVDLLIFAFIQNVFKHGNDHSCFGRLQINDKCGSPFTWNGRIQPYFPARTMNLRSSGKSLVVDLECYSNFWIELFVEIVHFDT